MKQKFLIAANWKMFPPPSDALRHPAVRGPEGPSGPERELRVIPSVVEGRRANPYLPRADIDVVVFPTFLHLEACIKAGLAVGAQYGHEDDQGAHTGDVSMKMLKEIGCLSVLCGHSERRAAHHETNEQIAAQVVAARSIGLHPILCIGETWEERKAGKQEDVVREQLQTVLKKLEATSYPSERPEGRAGKLEAKSFTIAYEPVWAISGGDQNKPAATPSDAQQMHSFIRNILRACHPELVEGRILYGGSMKPENAQELLELPDVDGGLIGGASLKPESFQQVLDIAAKLTQGT